MAEMLKALAYARFSSEGQREESIEAQLRAINEFAEREGYVVCASYVDRAISGTTDNRPEFLRMIDDAKNGYCDAIICHKLDRFARNRADAAIYRRELSKNNVRLISVLENFDDSPESIILQSVIEGYNEYYSKNLRREVLKGLRENALSCRFTGGIPPLGYNINKETLKYEIDEYEAEAVKLIFKMYLEGEGYTAIINELNRRGFKTKRGRDFGKNSLYEVLRNERYTGNFVYNKSVGVRSDGKWNRHKTRNEADVIRIENGIPQIISKEDFNKVQEKMAVRKHKTATFKAKQDYLLSGKIVCGECGSTYAGNSRKPNKKNPLYISYNCTRKNHSLVCKNSGVKKETIEQLVLDRLSKMVFDDKFLPTIIAKYDEYALSRNKEYIVTTEELKRKIAETEKGINNIVNVVVATGSAALADKLKELEKTKQQLEHALFDAERKISAMKMSKRKLKDAFNKAKYMLRSGTLKNKKAIVQQYVKQVTMFKDRIEIEYNVSDTYSFKEEVTREVRR